MRSRLVVALALAGVAALGLASCGGDDDTSAQGDTSTNEDTSPDTLTSEEDSGGSAGSQGGGTATIIFANGEVLSTDVLCNLESQVAAGQEILYTATSLRNPYFDVTVFGPSSDFEGATATWDETEDFVTYQVSWAAGELEAPGSSFEASLAGSTITGSGTFVRGEDASGQAGETREGTVEVQCG